MLRFKHAAVRLLPTKPRSLKFRLCVMVFSLVAVFGLANGLSHSKSSKAKGQVEASKPASRTGSGTSVTVRTERSGPGKLNLADGHELETTYVGSTELVGALGQNQTRALSLASADFDEDGVPDLISGYGTPNGGILTLHRGNIDAIYPNSPEAQSRKVTGEFSDSPFLREAQTIAVPQSPDFVGTGDFNADGHQDVVVTGRGQNRLWFLLGDGHGNFVTTTAIELSGAVTAFVTGDINRADGLTDVIVGVQSESGCHVLVFEDPEGAMRAKPETFGLSARANALVVGQFDEDSEQDLAIAAGKELLIVSGRDRKLSLDSVKQSEVPFAKIELHQMAYSISSLAAGDFVWDKDQRTELALLDAQGAVHFMTRGRPSDTITSRRTKTKPRVLAWSERQTSIKPDSPLRSSDTTAQSSILTRARVSGHQTDDLLLLDSPRQQIHLFNVDPGQRDQNGETSSSESGEPVTNSLDFDASPVAVLPMKLNKHAIDGLMVLQNGQNTPTVLPAAPGAIITVNSTDDTDAFDNVLTLREALLVADGTLPLSVLSAGERAQVSGTPSVPGLDEIRFSIGTGLKTINLLSQLPTIGDGVTIDGTTQPGFASAGSRPIIEIKGKLAPGTVGFLVQTSNCLFEGLVINEFDGDAIRMFTGTGHIIRGNFIGTDQTGTIAKAAGGVTMESSVGNTIGGTTASARNVISGNHNDGILMYNSQGTGNTIQGNYIGVDVNGTAALPNGRLGIFIAESSNHMIGGTFAGSRNIISGNISIGIQIQGVNSFSNKVLGNYIGTSVTGSTAIGNLGGGLYIISENSHTVGGTAVNAGNVIAGNPFNGINLFLGTGNIVQGNFLGTNATGTAAVAGFSSDQAPPGIIIINASNTLVGGVVTGARNIISGNTRAGIEIYGGPTNFGEGKAVNNVIQGNYVGTDITGTKAIPNDGDGIRITAINEDASNTIGGDTVGARNIVSGNNLNGVSVGVHLDDQHLDAPTVAFLSSGATGIVIKGNYIGTDLTGTLPLGNHQNGIFIETRSIANTIQNNLIAFNGGNGILIPNTSSNGGSPAVQIDLQGNLLSSNTRLGVDLGGDAGTNGDGPTPNTPGVHTTGANLLQNKPLLQSAGPIAFPIEPGSLTNSTGIGVSGLGIVVSGTYQSVANQTFKLQFYFGSNCQNAGAAPNQSGQFIGVIPFPLGTKQVTTDAQGNASYSFVFPIPGTPATGFVNSQATSLVGNSSEISACQAVTTTSLDPPTISSITPTAGAGSQVTINGTNLQNGTVTFTGTSTPAQIISNTNAQLIVIVPIGTTSGPITVKTLGGTAVSSNFTIKPAPSITWSNPADIVVGTALSGLQLNATFKSNGQTVPGTAVYNPPAGTKLSGGLNQVLSVTFTPTDQNSFGSTTGTVLINVLKLNQTINFGTLANKTFGDTAFTVTASATSGLPVAFSVQSGPATINGTSVTLTGAGTVTIQANQGGDGTFNSAPVAQQSFTVAKAQAVINLTNLIQIFDGAPKSVIASTTPLGLSGLTVTYNGSANPPSALGTYALVASLNHANYQASNSLATFRVIAFSSIDSKNANPGAQNTAIANPTGNKAGVTAKLTHASGGVTANVTVGVYSDNPTDRGLVNAGGGFVDVKVSNPNAADTVVVNYYYPNTVTGANETALQLYYFKGSSWLPVKGSANAAPVKVTTDNLDGTVSGGKFTVTLDNTSSPKVSELTGTVFAATTALMGDINGDNIVNVSDLVLMANILAGNVTPTVVQKAAADVQQDGTGKITVSDLITLANFLAGNTKTLPVGGP